MLSLLEGSVHWIFKTVVSIHIILNKTWKFYYCILKKYFNLQYRRWIKIAQVIICEWTLLFSQNTAIHKHFCIHYHPIYLLANSLVFSSVFSYCHWFTKLFPRKLTTSFSCSIRLGIVKRIWSGKEICYWRIRTHVTRIQHRM